MGGHLAYMRVSFGLFIARREGRVSAGECLGNETGGPGLAVSEGCEGRVKGRRQTHK